jgi:hypothetical protein
MQVRTAISIDFTGPHRLVYRLENVSDATLLAKRL